LKYGVQGSVAPQHWSPAIGTYKRSPEFVQRACTSVAGMVSRSVNSMMGVLGQVVELH